jgi:AraC family transcriptional regulator, ethanolamine operon transcriptional activator
MKGESMATSPVQVERKFALPGIDMMRRAFDECRMEAISLSEGELSGTLGSYRHGAATLCSFVADFAIHARFVLPPGHFLSCYVYQAAQDSWCAGMPLRSGTMLLALPGSPCEMMLAPESKISLVVAPMRSSVASAIESNPDSFGDAGQQFSLFRPECHADARLGARYAVLFDSLIGKRHGMSVFVESGMADALVDDRALNELFAQTFPALTPADGYRPHYPMLRKAVRFMRTNLHRDIYIEEIAAAVQISDRSLRHVFDDLLGVSPTRYLSLLRLHEASRRLSVQGNAGRPSIKAVAMSCGLWDLSRFAANYRRAFGEHPSATLMRTCSFAS